jgi:hypothetical protein
MGIVSCGGMYDAGGAGTMSLGSLGKMNCPCMVRHEHCTKVYIPGSTPGGTRCFPFYLNEQGPNSDVLNAVARHVAA